MLLRGVWMTLDMKTKKADRAIINFGFDEFERNLLPLIRHFVIGIQGPDTKGWQSAFTIASQRWGETFGLGVAYSMMRVIQSLLDSRDMPLAVNDPLDIEHRACLTQDEQALIAMLHYMRRDRAGPARLEIERLTPGRTDSYMLRAALEFAHRFANGTADHAGAKTATPLSIVT